MSSASEFALHIRGMQFALNKEVMVAKSAKLATLLQENPSQQEISHQLRDIPCDPQTFHLVIQFCRGQELNLTNDNVVPLCCIANYLRMTEEHSPNNLLNKAISFFQKRIINSWNESVKVLKNSEFTFFKTAVDMGLIDACAESVIARVLVSPYLLGDPLKNDQEDEKEIYRQKQANVKRKLFDVEGNSEDLTSLKLRFYEPVMREIIQRHAPSEHVAASLASYAKKWVFSRGNDDNNSSPREVIEAIERLLPSEKGLLPCTELFQMLRAANELRAISDCRMGFEVRIGKQLDEAKVEDLLMTLSSFQDDDVEIRCDTECIRRVMKTFYYNYSSREISELITVAELVEGFLMGLVGSDRELKLPTFLTLADMTVTASAGTPRFSDGIYRVIDMYLHKNKHFTEMEREEVCHVLDCHRMTAEAREHAAQNERLPLRVVVQVLFASQLQLRESIIKEVKCSDDRSRKVEEEEEEGWESGLGGEEEEEVRVEMEKMGSKVMELERECLGMKREIENVCCCKKGKKEKGVSVWKEMKRKFGCMSGSKWQDCNNCHVKKKKIHPK